MTAPRSPKVGKNIDKSLRKCSQSQTTLLFGVACYHICWFVVPNVTKQVFVLNVYLKCFTGLRIEPTFTVDSTPRL